MQSIRVILARWLAMSVNLQPALYGILVMLRPLRSNDFQRLYKVASDKLIWDQHPEPKRAQKEYFRNNFFKSGFESGGCLVALNSKQDFIGCSRYYNYRPKHNDIAIGYTFLVREYWETSVNREMKHLMLSHIFQWVQTVLIIISASNMRSRKACEKLGFQLLSDKQLKEKQLDLVKKVVYQIKNSNFKGFV